MYRELPAPAALSGLVECGWLAATGPQEVRQVHDVLPDGCMDVIWSGGALVVAGPDTAPHAAPREPGDVAVGLRFAPGALPGLLGVPATALRDQRVPLGELHPRLTRRVESRLSAAGPLGAAEVGSGLVTLALALPGG
ncbi:MAG: hypothetical protein L0H64_14610, partial [Pseudonocardia sp.]|nr:hypothetical protein [Pseudonocardia sp.]